MGPSVRVSGTHRPIGGDSEGDPLPVASSITCVHIIAAGKIREVASSVTSYFAGWWR